MKIYKSTAPMAIKFAVLIGILISFLSLYISTIFDKKFVAISYEKNISAWEFLLKYPHDVLAVFAFLIIPGIYYGFIRGITFFEHGIVINRGLPFFNHSLKYDQLSSYSIVHPSYLLSLKRNDTQDEILFTVRRMDRAIAILDQHLVREEASNENKPTINANFKFILIIVIFSMVVFTAQHLGVFKPYLN